MRGFPGGSSEFAAPGDRDLTARPAGGRVLGVTASGEDLGTAIARAYQAVAKIRFDGAHYRRDIGQKGLKRWEGLQRGG